MANILIVEDSEDFQRLIQQALREHRCVCVSTVEDGLMSVRNRGFDLIVLDIGLPDRTGFEFLSDLYAAGMQNEAPVICVSGKNEITDKVTAFSLGAEDYILKPFHPIELKARVNAKLRKASLHRGSKAMTFDGLEIDNENRRVSIQVDREIHEIHLTQTEFKLLYCLAKRPNQVFTRDQLLVAAWGENARVLDRAVDVHLCSLRKKIGSHSSKIKAVAGLGYKFDQHSRDQAR